MPVGAGAMAAVLGLDDDAVRAACQQAAHAEVLQGALAGVEVSAPQVPVLNNVDVATPAEPAAIRDALVRQAWHPVRWVETLRAMKELGVTHVIECGPGKVLTGLTKRIDADLTGIAITDPASLEAALAAVNGN
ncbi:malonyl CoA-acyl carrier protein transacylase [Bordetella pertussis]|nr:malonyl CoA-acyl carrier protein transacylase [Bordetella pertussis]